MNPRLQRFALVGLVASIACADAHAQTAVNGPYYATPSWDQTLPAPSRFLVLSNFSNDAVLDRETGLVWWRSLTNFLGGSYAAAQSVCLGSTVDGRYGWRLPTADEVLSLFDPAVTTGSHLPTGHPFVINPANFFTWTSTPAAPTPQLPQSTNFINVYISYEGDLRVVNSASIFSNGTICVRGKN